MLLSLLLPGLGHTYNREITKGAVIFGFALSLAALSLVIPGLSKVTALLALLLLWASAAIDAYQMAKVAGQPREFYYRKTFVVAMLFLIGPLALPLLWQSPNFTRIARWLWSILVVGVALLFLATPYLLKGIVV